jgi:hypothetical protein
MDAGRTRMMEIVRASTRKAAILRSFVWELSVMKPLVAILVKPLAGVE